MFCSVAKSLQAADLGRQYDSEEAGVRYRLQCGLHPATGPRDRQPQRRRATGQRRRHQSVLLQHGRLPQSQPATLRSHGH